jgi:hypothetical protein
LSGLDRFPSLLPAGLLAVGAVVAIVARRPAGSPAKYDLTKRLRQVFAGRSAAAQSLEPDEAANPLAQTPYEWLAARGVAAGLQRERTDVEWAVRRALEDTLTQGHAPWPVEALCFAFHVASHCDRETRGWFFLEMATRFKTAVSADDFAAFVNEARKRHVRLADLYDADKSHVAARHAYPATRALALLAYARTKTVLPCADFLWLKAVDRPLWYALNNLGRRAYHVEGAAAISHYLSERAARAAVSAPQVAAAADGILLYLDEMGADPDVVMKRANGSAAASFEAINLDKDPFDGF